MSNDIREQVHQAMQGKRITLICVSTGKTSTSDGNSNKFHTFERQGPDQWKHTYGRVGTPGTSHTVSDGKVEAKCREALSRGGYRLLDMADAGVPGVVSAGDVAAVAVRDVAAGDRVVEDVLRRLAAANRHQILASTSLTVSDTTGLFSTPLGVVTRDTVKKARVVHQRLRSHVTSGSSGSVADRDAAEFAMLIPQDIGRKAPTMETICPDGAAWNRLLGVLDALDVSLDGLASAPAATAGVGAPVFRLRMAQVDAAETKRVSALFRKTRQAMHACHGYEVSRVLSVEIEHEGPAFATDGEVIGGIRELWHGSQASNILSILRSGLVVPKTAAHGRMFGDGIYFSDQSTKALNYATGWWSGRGSQPEAFMFLAQVAMGKMYRPRGPMGGGALPAGYDSVFAEAGRAGVQNNEMIVARPSQVRVMRLVEFTG